MAELCVCAERFPVKVMFSFSESEFCCMNCNLEVENVLYSEFAQSKDFIYWRSEYKAIYELWLVSGRYEAWAKEELSSPKSHLNQAGLRLARNAPGEVQRYYWVHSEDGKLLWKAGEACRNCTGTLKLFKGKALNQVYCDTCGVVAAE